METTLIYLPIKDIEGFKKKLENAGNEVEVTICYDSKNNHRKEVDKNYKSGRAYMPMEEYNFVDLSRQIFEKIGYNVLKIDTYEADDLITEYVSRTRDKYDVTIIMTNDKDLAVNVCENVALYRFKWTTGFGEVTYQNFSEYWSNDFKVEEFPYNSMLLYLCTVGDKADRVKGINGFGVKAFDKLIKELKRRGLHFEMLSDADNVKSVLEAMTDYLGEDKVKEAEEALELVKPARCNELNTDDLKYKYDKNKAKAVYEVWNFKSIVKLLDE